MPQLHLPMFPNGVTAITDVLAFGSQDGRITYFSGQLPVFSHAEDDVASFRMITSQFCVQGCARQSDIIRAFGVTSISVKRSVKTYCEKGPKGFYPKNGSWVIALAGRIGGFGWDEPEPDRSDPSPYR